MLKNVVCQSAGLLFGLREQETSSVGWRHALQTIGSDLESLAESIEGEFLSIGEKLQGFHQRTLDLSTVSSAVAGLMSGEELGAVIGVLRGVIDTMKQLAGQTKRNSNDLRALTEKLARLDDIISCFHGDIRQLRILCVSTRIESARMEKRSAGFKELADEVGDLSFDIEDRCFRLLSTSGSLSHLVGQTLSSVHELETTQQDRVRIVLDKTMSGLESLMEKHAQSSAAAERISAGFESVSQRIGQIVVSLQFQDITRQRVEHARQALADLEIQSGREHRHLVAEVSVLQAAQLKNAKDELVAAVNSISGNLRALADIVEEMTRETSALSGSADKTGHSSLSEVEAVVSSVASTFEKYGETDKELSRATGAVGGMLGDISSHTVSIESIGDKIKLIALNAIVQAHRIGEKGATLTVLAEAIHQLSNETRRRTEIAGEVLRSIIAVSQSLYAAVNAHGSNRGGKLATTAEVLGTQLQTLSSLNGRIASMLQQMNVDGCGLCAEFRKNADSMKAHRRIEEVIGNVVGRLEKLVEVVGPGKTVVGEARSAERMKALEASYTMEVERDVHRSLLQQGETGRSHPAREETAPPTGGGAEDGLPADEDDLGDNVELF
jgi:methyl-accepting chemotaxis protein